MAGIATVTATGKVGPGNTITAGVFNNVTKFTVDPVNCLLILEFGTTVFPIDISAATTCTATLSGAAGNWTVTVS